MPTSGTEYVTVDDVGTTRLITDSNGNVLERHDFEPFGHELLGTEGGWRSSVAGYGVTPTSVRQQFTGQERDDTGLDFFQGRYFTSAQGRFASVDPGNAGASLGDPQSWNGYSYVSNSPLRFTDPTGEGFWGDIGFFIGAAIGSFIPGANVAFDALFGFVVGNVIDVEQGGLSALSPIPGMRSLPSAPPGAGGLGGVFGGGGGPGGGVYGGGSAGGDIFSFGDGDQTGFWTTDYKGDPYWYVPQSGTVTTTAQMKAAPRLGALNVAGSCGWASIRDNLLGIGLDAGLGALTVPLPKSLLGFQTGRLRKYEHHKRVGRPL
jgi:RHS repeat-associated protein